MRYLKFILLLGLVTDAQADVIDRVVAVVNDDIVTLSELEDVTRKQLGRLNKIMDPVTGYEAQGRAAEGTRRSLGRRWSLGKPRDAT